MSKKRYSLDKVFHIFTIYFARGLMVDTLGLVHELLLSEANKHDRPEVKILISSIQRAYLRVEKLIADKGYDSEEFIRWVKSTKKLDSRNK